MVKGTFCEKSISRICTGLGDGDHDSRTRSRRAKCDWLPGGDVLARFKHRILWCSHVCGGDHCPVLRPANGKRVRWSSGACSVLSADVDSDLSARTTVNQ